MQQQYGLPINGVWGSLERQVFDNSRATTAPPASALSLLPPASNKTTKYAKVSSAAVKDFVPTAVKSTLAGADVGGIVSMAGLGLFTAAVVCKADAIRRTGRSERMFKPGATQSAFENMWNAVTGGGEDARRQREYEEQQRLYYEQQMYDQGAGYYDEHGIFRMNAPAPNQAGPRGGPPPRRQNQNARCGGGGWYDAANGYREEYDAFPGGYPMPPPNQMRGDDGHHPRAPVRPGDRVRADADARGDVDDAPGYHPAFDRPDGPAARRAPAQPPRGGMQNAQNGGARAPSWDGRDDGYAARQMDDRSDFRRGGGGGGGYASMGGGPAPSSRTTASVPQYGGWANDGGGAGPAAVPEYGGAEDLRTFAAHPNLAGNASGLGAKHNGVTAMQTAASATATATLSPPAPPELSRRPNKESALEVIRGVAGTVGDGIRNLAAPNGAVSKESSEFTVRAARERELLAQITEAQEYAKMEQKKRQQLEAAFQSTRNALKDAEEARSGLKTQQALSAEMKQKMAELEKALKDRDVAAASAVFTQSNTANGVDKGLKNRIEALETALAKVGMSSAAGPGSAAAVAAMTHLQEKVKMLEEAFSQRSASADVAATAAQKVDAIAATVQADADAVPELRQQVKELREAMQSGGAGGAALNLGDVNARIAKLEETLAKTVDNPLSIDVLFAKVAAVEEGLAAAANGSAGMIQELSDKIVRLEGGLGGAGTVTNNIVSPISFAPPAAPASPPAAPPTPTPTPTFDPPKPQTDVPVKNPLPPTFQPSITITPEKAASDAPGPARPPEKETPAVKKIETPDQEILEEHPLPRIATGREVMMQGFNWESHKFEWYSVVGERATQIRDAGFTQIWLPPCTDSLAPEGYLPRNLRSLDTKYGTEQQLRSLIGTLRENNILPVLDAVLNHRCATHQGNGGKWNRWEGTGMDWGEWAITNRNKDFMGEGGDPTGDEFWGSPNIDHREPRVQESLCEWIKWLTHDVGFGGIRFDFSKGYGGEFTGKYVRACMPEFAVGEFWDTLNYGQGLEYDQDAHRQRIVDWIDATGGICTAFDFTTKGILQEACGRGEFWRLVDKKGRAPGVIGLWPARAVTFIDNHDTGSTQSHWPFPSNKVGMGYAYILTHPGTPSVFWDHFFDWGSDLRKQITGLLEARKAMGVHARSKLEIVAATDSVYAALVDDKLAVKLGHDNWSPSGDGWKVSVSGDQWCVWTRG